MTDKFIDQMQNELSNMEIILTKQQMEQFFKYYEFLIEWNDKVNLTAITKMEDVITKHFVDSLALVKVITDLPDKDYTLVDVGTGAGFPGIPLKIVFLNLRITLLDSLNKRVKFLNEVIDLLGLSDIEAVHGRAEDLGHDSVSREKFDLCVSRAVANIATLSEYCLPFVKLGGYFISYKSGKIEEELEAGKGAIRKLSAEIEEVVNFQLPNADERSFVKIRKIGKLKNIYPRKAGLPSKEPLS